MATNGGCPAGRSSLIEYGPARGSRFRRRLRRVDLDALQEPLDAMGDLVVYL
jgi:hypothetical protein